MQSTFFGESQGTNQEPSASATGGSSSEQPDAVERRHNAGSASSVNVGQTERMLSVLLGAGLVVLLRRPSLPRVALALGGGALLHRGLTGHCHAYDALGIDTARGHAALGTGRAQPNEITAAITIRASAEELQRRFLDATDLDRIMGHFAEVRANSDGGLHWTVRGKLGMELEWDSRVEEARSGEHILVRSSENTRLANELEVQFSPAPRDFGTVVKLKWRFEAPLATAVSRLLGGPARIAAETALRRLKSLVETGEIPTNRMRDNEHGDRASAS